MTTDGEFIFAATTHRPIADTSRTQNCQRRTFVDVLENVIHSPTATTKSCPQAFKVIAHLKQSKLPLSDSADRIAWRRFNDCFLLAAFTVREPTASRAAAEFSTDSHNLLNSKRKRGALDDRTAVISLVCDCP